MATRDQVYEAIDSEREHQIQSGRDQNNDANNHLGDWLTYIDVYVRRAQGQLTEGQKWLALVELRKIAALCVAAMEVEGAPVRANNVF